MRWRVETLALSLAAACAVAGVARAETRRVDMPPSRADTDTSYGRIEGDVGIVVGAGVAVAARAPRAEGDLRLRYLDTIGIFATYEDGPLVGASPDPRRVFAVGAELRPLFLGRWLTGRELGARWLDLAIDSIGLELGIAMAQPPGTSFASRPGLQAGLGLELPILGASGPWIGLHGGARWSYGVLSGDPIDTPSDRGAFLGITLAWHQLVVAHVVDVGDLAPR